MNFFKWHVLWQLIDIKIRKDAKIKAPLCYSIITYRIMCVRCFVYNAGIKWDKIKE